MSFLLFLVALASSLQSPGSSMESAADRMEQKLERLDKNGKAGKVQPLTTVLTEEEINAYFALRMGKHLPPGVSNVRFELHPDRPSAYGIVDFDQYKAASRKPVNPILGFLLQGRKDVAVRGTFDTPSPGYGLFHLESVTIGSFNASGSLLNWLVHSFVLPRYPTAAVDRPFELPAHMRRAVVLEGSVILYQ